MEKVGNYSEPTWGILLTLTGEFCWPSTIADDFKIKTIIHYPDKSKLEVKTNWAYSKICYERNTLIAQDSDILIACVSPDRKGGTEDTINKYLKMGKDKLVIV